MNDETKIIYRGGECARDGLIIAYHFFLRHSRRALRHR